MGVADLVAGIRADTERRKVEQSEDCHDRQHCDERFHRGLLSVTGIGAFDGYILAACG